MRGGQIENAATLNAERSTVSVQRSTPETIRHIYVHIPFCARICPYCAFYKERADAALTQRFCEAVLAEVQQHARTFRLAPETIFFGGGTPTALTTSQLEFLLRGFHEALDLSALREWTFEANPGSLSSRKAALLRDMGVTRISLGVQSFDDGLLTVLGREHDARKARLTFRELREAGFENLNIDLMFGIPGQTEAQWRDSLRSAISLDSDHISAYCLTYEEDTDFFLRHARGEFHSNNDSDAAFLETAIEILEAAGYAHYEISNYARTDKASVHNRAYWAGADYLGIGPSAVSTVGSQRWQNVCDYRAYSDRLAAGESIVTNEESLTPALRRFETTALLLRTRDGVPARWLEQRRAAIEEFTALGLVETNGERLRLTNRGKLLADSVTEALL